MSASPSSTRGPATGGSVSASGPRSTTRGSPSPSVVKSGSVSSAGRQMTARTATRATGTRALRTAPSSENRGQPDQMNTETLQELHEYANVQEAEIARLTAQARENEVVMEEARKESISLRQDLDDARLEMHRLEDQLELRQEEIERLNAQIRESQKSKLDTEKLAESERQRLLEEKQMMVRSNGELSAQLKVLRTSLQMERSRETSQSPNPKGEEGDDVTNSDSLAAALREKDRQIDSLRLELAEIEIRLAEESNSSLARARQVEEALIQAKLENIRLAEDVESYQILLQDRTLKGEYSIMNVEGVPETDEALSSRSTSPLHDDHRPSGVSLAKELEEAEAGADASKIRALQTEIRHLKDSNKAMGLYINEIIGRLLQTQGFEKVLEKDVNKLLPPPLHERRLPPSRVSHETTPRRSFAIDNSTAAHKRLPSEVGIGGGLSRAFSFRRKPDPIPNLRPLKLVEEQQPQAALRSDGTLPHARSRTHNDENDEAAEIRAAKRTSWVPGWFAKTGLPSADEK